MNRRKKKILALIIAAAVLGSAAFALYLTLAEDDGMKTIAVKVTHGNGSSKTFEIHTAERFLRGALEQEKLAEGLAEPYGLFITTVNGETADEFMNQWWRVTGNGQPVTADTEEIMDGGAYELTLITGYDIFS